MSVYPCRWNGEDFEPLQHIRKRCDAELVIGEVYFLQPVHDRSATSHRHAFAWLHNVWQHLPEQLAEQYPTAEHLRKRALIEAGYFQEEIIDAGSTAAALRVAAYVRGKDQFALVIVRGKHVIVRHAASQSYPAMKRAEFQRSKTAVMEIVAKMIGVPVEQLQKETAREPA